MATATKLPESGRASVVTAWDAPLEIKEYPVLAPEPGAILVRIDKATVCGSDVHVWDGGLSQMFPIELPVILGHEQVGRVVAFGDGDTRDSVGNELKEGDRVTWEHEACGHCYVCSVEKKGSLCSSRRIGFLENSDRAPHFNGVFSEYSYVWPKSGRLKVPDDVKSEWASAASCALRTVINSIERLGPIDYRHNVVIQGAGPLGLFATAVMATHRPRKLIVIGGPAARLEVARAWGADLTIAFDEVPDAEERKALVMEATDGRGADVIGEYSGGRTAVAEAIPMAALNGRLAVVGTVGGEPQPIAAHLITHKNLSVYGSLSGEIDSYYKAMEFMRRNRQQFDWDLMMGNEYDLDNLTEGMQRMRDFEEIKAVVVPNPS